MEVRHFLINQYLNLKYQVHAFTKLSVTYAVKFTFLYIFIGKEDGKERNKKKAIKHLKPKSLVKLSPGS